MLLKSSSRPKARIIDGPVRVAVLTEAMARDLDFLLDFPCDRGAGTADDLRAISEVRDVLHALHAGLGAARKVVVPYDREERPISLAVVSIKGDGKLTREPYVEALARHNDFHRTVLGDGSTSAGGAAIRAVLDVLGLRYGRDLLPSVTARVLRANGASHSILAQYRFEALPRRMTETEQVIRWRPALLPAPARLPASVYVQPSPQALFLPAFARRRRSFRVRADRGVHGPRARATRARCGAPSPGTPPGAGPA